MLGRQRTLPNGLALMCDCQRETCGILKDPIVIDQTDAEKMWLPNAFQNAVKDSQFQVWLLEATEKQRAQSVKAIFATRLEAAREYIRYQVQGLQPKGIKDLEGTK